MFKKESDSIGCDARKYSNLSLATTIVARIEDDHETTRNTRRNETNLSWIQHEHYPSQIKSSYIHNKAKTSSVSRNIAGYKLARRATGNEYACTLKSVDKQKLAATQSSAEYC